MRCTLESNAARRFQQKMAAMGQELPDDWQIPIPELPDSLLFVWRCWWRLHTDRPWMGGGLGPMVPGRIPWRDVKDWAAFHEMSGEQFIFLDQCVRAMDDVFCEWHATKPKEDAS